MYTPHSCNFSNTLCSQTEKKEAALKPDVLYVVSATTLFVTVFQSPATQ